MAIVRTVLTIHHDENLVSSDFLADHVIELEGIAAVEITAREETS